MNLTRALSVLCFSSILLLAACGGGEEAESSQPQPEPSPTLSAEEAALQGKVMRQVLNEMDLPLGFTQDASQFVSNDVAARTSSLTLEEMKSWGRLIGYRSTFGSQSSLPAEGALMYVDCGLELYAAPDGAEKAFDYLTRDDTQKMKASIESTGQFVNVSVDELALGTYGDESKAWVLRATRPASGDQLEVKMVSVKIVMRNGTSVGLLDVKFLDQPDEATADALARKLAERLARG